MVNTEGARRQAILKRLTGAPPSSAAPPSATLAPPPVPGDGGFESIPDQPTPFPQDWPTPDTTPSWPSSEGRRRPQDEWYDFPSRGAQDFAEMLPPPPSSLPDVLPSTEDDALDPLERRASPPAAERRTNALNAPFATALPLTKREMPKGGWTPGDFGTGVTQRGTLDPDSQNVRIGGNKGSMAGASAGAALAGPTMGASVGIGALIGRIAGSRGRSETGQTDYRVEDAREILADVYYQALGREASQQEIDAHLRNQGWDGQSRWIGADGLTFVVNEILKSDEAKTAASAPQHATGPAEAPAPDPTTPTTPTGPTALSTYAPMAGWEESRLNDKADNAPKYVFGRFVQDWLASGKPGNADAVRAFVAQDPRWEIEDNGDDPKIRVKQSELDTWEGKQGHASVWQDVIRDAGGANAPQFMNVGGDAGTVPPPGTGSSPTDGQGFSGAGADLFNGDAMARIQAELNALIAGQRSPFTRSAVMKRLTGDRS